MRSLTAPLAVLVVAAVAYSAMNASRAGAAEARIGGFAFGCEMPGGATLKPTFGDIDGALFIDLPAQRRVCLDTVDRIIARCGENTGFASNTEDRRHAGCLPVFERQAEACAAFFRAEKAKCDAGGDPEEVEGGLGLSREDRRLVQMGLSSAGYDPGPADGLIGERTREAIRRWQGSRGEAETGYLDADGAKELLGLGERAAAALEPNCEGLEEAAVVCEGPYVDGKRHGRWVVRYADGSVHEGPYVDGKAHGRWVARGADGTVGKGPVVDGKQHGHWVVRQADGDVHEGPYVDGKRHGRWVAREADGTVAEGPVVDDKRHGHWVVRLADGTVWEGPYVDDKRHGRWVVRWADGDVSERRFVDDKLQ